MKMDGVQMIAADRETVWNALNDPDVLRVCIPGCEEMNRVSANEFNAIVKQKIGPVSARFESSVELSDIVEGQSLRLSGEGKGGVAGMAKGGAQVRLADAPGGTRLDYDAEGSVAGKIAQLGSRLIDGVAHKMADEFFVRFKEIVEGVSGGKSMAGAAAANGSGDGSVGFAGMGAAAAGVAAGAAASAQGALGAASDAVSGAVDSGAQAVSGAWNAASDAAGDVASSAQGAVDGAVGAVSDAVSGAVDSGVQAVSGAWNAASDAAGDVASSAQGAVDGAVDAVSDAVDSGAQAASGAWNAASDAAGDMAASAQGAVSDVAAAAAGTVAGAGAAVAGSVGRATDALDADPEALDIDVASIEGAEIDADSVWQDAREIATHGGDAAGAALGETRSAAERTLANVDEAMEAARDAAQSDAAPGDGISGTVAAAAGAAAAAAGTLAAKASGALDELHETAKEKVIAAGGEVDEARSWAETKAHAGKAGESYEDAAEDAWDAAKAKAQGLHDKAEEEWSEAKEHASEAWKETREAGKDALTTATGYAAEEARSPSIGPLGQPWYIWIIGVVALLLLFWIL